MITDSLKNTGHLYLYNSLYFLLLLSIQFFKLLKSGIDKSTERSTIPVSPSLMSFFNRGNNTDGTFLQKFCLMFVYVCVVWYGFVSGLVLWIFEDLWFHDLCAE